MASPSVPTPAVEAAISKMRRRSASIFGRIEGGQDSKTWLALPEGDHADGQGADVAADVAIGHEVSRSAAAATATVVLGPLSLKPGLERWNEFRHDRQGLDDDAVHGV